MRDNTPFIGNPERPDNCRVNTTRPLEAAERVPAESLGIDLREHSLSASPDNCANLVERHNTIAKRSGQSTSWQTVRLNGGVVVGMGASTFVAASTIVASGAYLLPHHPIAGAVIALLGARSFFVTIQKAFKAHGAFSSTARKHDDEVAPVIENEQQGREWKRVRQSMSRVNSRLGGTIPKMEVTTAPSFYFIEELWGKNVLGFNPDISCKLSDRELDSLIAHELSHENQIISKLSLLAEPTIKSTRFIAFCSTAYLTFSAMSLSMSSPVGGVFALGAGVGAGIAAAGVMTLLAFLPEQIARRSNEILADYRAVKATQDLEAYRSALQKAHKLALGEEKEFRARNLSRLLYEHPSIEERMDFLEKI